VLLKIFILQMKNGNIPFVVITNNFIFIHDLLRGLLQE